MGTIELANRFCKFLTFCQKTLVLVKKSAKKSNLVCKGIAYLQVPGQKSVVCKKAAK